MVECFVRNEEIIILLTRPRKRKITSSTLFLLLFISSSIVIIIGHHLGKGYCHWTENRTSDARHDRMAVPYTGKEDFF